MRAVGAHRRGTMLASLAPQGQMRLRIRDRRDTTAQRNCSMENAFTPHQAMIGCDQPKPKGGQHMKYLPTLAAGLLIGAAALQFSTAASGEGDGWVKLI